MSHAPSHAPEGNVQKADDFKRAWKDLLVFLRPYLPLIVLAGACILVSTVFTVIGPDYLKQITDLISAGMGAQAMDYAAIASIGMFLLSIYLVSAVLNYGQGYLMATAVQRISKKLRTEISEKINRMPLRYFDCSSHGDVLSRVTNDVDTLGQSLSQCISTLMSAAIMLVGSLVMMFLTDGIMAVTAVLSAVLGFAIMMLIVTRSQKYFDRQQKYLGQINGFVEETYTGHNIVKAYNGGRAASKQFGEMNDALFDSAFKSLFFSGLMMPLMGFIGNLGYVAVCIVGAVQVLQGHISVGVIVAFIVYVRLFTQPLSQIGQAATSIQSAAAASERVFEFLREEEMDDESGKTAVLTEVRGEVEFRDVCFGYAPGNEVIHRLSVKVRPGEKVAIVGPTGAGKTTIVNLLMRFYEVNSGEILIDGVPTAEMTRESVHDLFCMVLQDTWLFGGTIEENVAYCKKGATREDVVEACKAVGIHHYISTLPDGYDTVLDDDINMSNGQKQQITIARAIVQDAPLLILDEATSSVDTRTEKIIQEAMDRLTDDRTSFVIAHRLSTIKDADMILVMRNGSIIERGDHEELLAAGGFYSELYNSQFEEYDED
jgi:ATP-binding cassette, subfamily B, multidrug efflux pump